MIQFRCISVEPSTILKSCLHNLFDTTNSDIDWSQSIPNIDQQLYNKYGLSKEEITFIEEKVQPME